MKYFDLKHFTEFRSKVSEIPEKLLFGLNIHIAAFFRRFKIGRKLVKNRRLARLLLGQITVGVKCLKIVQNDIIFPKLSYLRLISKV